MATDPVYYLTGLVSRNVAANRLTTPSPAIMFPITATMNFSVTVKTSTGRQVFPEKNDRLWDTTSPKNGHQDTGVAAGVTASW